MYARLGHGGSGAMQPLPPPPLSPQPQEDAEYDDSFNEFLDMLNENEAAGVHADELQAAIAASIETEFLEGNNARTANKVNQVLLERAMEISVDRHVYSETEHHRIYHEDEERVYHKAKLEVDACNRRQVLLAHRHLPPTPATLLHQEMSSPGCKDVRQPQIGSCAVLGWTRGRRRLKARLARRMPRPQEAATTRIIYFRLGLKFHLNLIQI
jgi:hypothetical protein